MPEAPEVAVVDELASVPGVDVDVLGGEAAVELVWAAPDPPHPPARSASPTAVARAIARLSRRVVAFIVGVNLTISPPYP